MQYVTWTELHTCVQLQGIVQECTSSTKHDLLRGASVGIDGVLLVAAANSTADRSVSTRPSFTLLTPFQKSISTMNTCEAASTNIS